MFLVDDILQQRPEGVQVLYQGSAHADFERPLPKTADPTLLARFEHFFNKTQVGPLLRPACHSSRSCCLPTCCCCL